MKKVLILLIFAIIVTGCGSKSNDQIKENNNLIYLNGTTNNNEVEKTITTVDEEEQEVIKTPKPDPVITYKDLITYEDIGFTTVRKNDGSIPKGKEVVSQNGVKG